MKQDLIKISSFLTNEVSELSLGDGLKYYVDNKDEEEPFEIVEKVKVDLEKVGKILSVGNVDKENEKSMMSDDESAEQKSQMIEPLLKEVRIKRATDCNSAHQKDASEMVSHLSTDLESYLQHLPVTAHPVQDENIVEEMFTEVVLPQKRHPPRIKKPARKKLKEREFVSCSSEDELERMSSEESLDGETVLGVSEFGMPPVSPKVIETPIGSIKDRVKALQRKVEEEEKEESVKVREVRRVTAVTAEENYTPPPKSPKSPQSQTERIEHSMSVKELMKAFQTGQDPSKSKSGLFEHKAITKMVVASTTKVSEENKIDQISYLQITANISSSEEVNSQSITGQTSQMITDQYQQSKIVISDEIIHEQVRKTSEDPSVSKTHVDISLSNKDSLRPSRLHSENTLVSVREELYKAPNEHRVQHGEQGETSDTSSVYQEKGKEEVSLSKDRIIQKKECCKELGQEKIHSENSAVILETSLYEEGRCSPETGHYNKLSTSHEQRTSEEPQISPDRKPSEDFSAVIKEELEESPEYQLFLQAAGPSPVSYLSYSETCNIQDGYQVEDTAVEHNSYKPKPAVRFAPAVVQSETFISTLIHDEINEKLNRSMQAGGDSTDIMFRNRTPRTSVGEDDAYEEFKQAAQTSPEKLIVSDQKVKSPTEPDNQTEEKNAVQLSYTDSGSPSKSAVQTRLEETQETEEEEKQDQDTTQVTFCMKIKSPVHTELDFTQKSPTDMNRPKVQTEQEICFQSERGQVSEDMSSNEVSSVETAKSVEFRKIQQMSSGSHDLEDPQPVTISDLKIKSPEMTPDEEDLSRHQSLDPVQAPTTEIKTEVEETHFHETEQVQQEHITTVEEMMDTEVQAQTHAEDRICFTVEAVVPVQNLDDSCKASVPEETKKIRKIYRVSSEVQEIQQMPCSTSSTFSHDILDGLQYITSDPESGRKSEMTPSKEDLSTQTAPDSVQVPSTDIKSPSQTKITDLHETEENDQHGYKSAVERFSPTEIQTQIQTEKETDINVGVESPVQELDDTCHAIALKETKQTRHIYKISSEETAESEEFLEIQQRLYSAANLCGLQHETMSGLQSACQEESTSGKDDISSPDSVQVSSTRIKSPVQTELEKTRLNEAAVEDQHAFITTEEELSPSKRPDQTEQEINAEVKDDCLVQELHDSYKVCPIKETEQMRGIDVNSVETAKHDRLQEIQQTLSRPDNLEDLQPVTKSEPKSVCQGDSLESTPIKEDLSSNKSPDSIEPSPSNDFPCPDSLETSPTGQRTEKRPGLLYQTSNDSQNSQHEVNLTENIELEISNKMIIQREAEIPPSRCLSTLLKPHPSSLDEENLQINGLVQRQATPNEEILRMGTEVGTLDEIKDPEIQNLHSDSSVELLVEDVKITEGMLIHDENNSSLCSEIPDIPEPPVPLQPSPEGNDEEEQEISEVKKQFTPEEKMFKMAAKIRVFDEIEKETKTRKVRFNFTTSSQNRDDQLQEKEEELQSCDESPLDYEEEDTQSSTVLSSYQQSEQCDDTPLTELSQEEPEQTLSEFSECAYTHGYGASEIGEMQLEILPMQIHIDKKELGHEDFTTGCLIKEDKADMVAALSEDSAVMLVDKETDSNSDIECHIIHEKTSEMPQSFIDTVCPENDGKAVEEHQPHLYGYEEDHRGKSQSISELIQGDLVPWSVKLEDDESFNSEIEAEEQKIYSKTSDTLSQESTLEMPPAQTPTENGQPNPFLFQEGKLFEMTRGGAVDMSRRSTEEERDAFAFFPINEDSSEDSPCEQVRESATEFSTSLEISLASQSEDSHQEVSGPSDEPKDSESHSDSESPKEIDLGLDSTIADIDCATSTVTRFIYSEQDMESSDSSAEEDQHSVIEIPTPAQDDLMLPGEETLQISSHWSLSSHKDPAAESMNNKPKSKIPVKATSFDHVLGKGDSTETNRRPKSEADISLSDFISGVHSSSVKPKITVSKIPVPIEQSSSGALHSGQLLHSHEDGVAGKSPDEKDSPRTVLDGDCRSKQFQTPTVGEDIFETRPNWEDCVETQMQRLSDNSSPDQNKGTYMVYGPFFPTLKNNPCPCPHFLFVAVLFSPVVFLSSRVDLYHFVD